MSLLLNKDSLVQAVTTEAKRVKGETMCYTNASLLVLEVLTQEMVADSFQRQRQKNCTCIFGDTAQT